MKAEQVANKQGPSAATPSAQDVTPQLAAKGGPLLQSAPAPASDGFAGTASAGTPAARRTAQPNEALAPAKEVSGVGALFAMALGVLVVGIPRRVAKVFGWGYLTRVEIEGKTIERPAEFASKAHKAAFEHVGRYVMDGLARDVMEVFRDKAVQADKFWGYGKIGLEVWHPVLEFFAAQGAIEARWTLSTPIVGADGQVTPYTYPPRWQADGSPLAPDASVRSPVAGLIPTEGAFVPELLTTAQKDALLGKPYALEAAKDGMAPQTQILSAADFERVFYRPQSVLAKKSEESAAQRLTTLLTKS